MRTNKFNDSKFLAVSSVLILTIMLLAGCNEGTAPTSSVVDDNAPEFLAKNGVIHHVSAGGGDLCGALGLPNGCDANFSLTANMKADGSVSGQWQDTFSGGGEGIHVAIDCMVIDGNRAIVSGVITHGTFGGNDVSGLRAVTAVVDNGTSSNDTADQISFSVIDTNIDCGTFNFDDFPLFDVTNGQVTVK